MFLESPGLTVTEEVCYGNWILQNMSVSLDLEDFWHLYFFNSLVGLFTWMQIIIE